MEMFTIHTFQKSLTNLYLLLLTWHLHETKAYFVCDEYIIYFKQNSGEIRNTVKYQVSLRNKNQVLK